MRRGLARLIRPVIFMPAFEPGFAHAFQRSSSLRRDYLRLMAGEVEYEQILVRLVLRLPRLGLLALRARL